KKAFPPTSLMELSILGGVNEIGGNRIMIRSRSGVLFFDYGKNFLKEEELFQKPFMQPTSEEDYLRARLISPMEIRSEDIKGVFISHAHQDHWGYLSLLPRGSSVFVGRAAKVIIGAQVELGHSDELTMEFSTFRTGDVIGAGDFSVVPVHVDHSVPGSYGFLIECCGRRVAYTGDLRMHGPRRDMTLDFIERASSEGVDLLITEATKVAPENDPEASLVRLLEGRVLYRWGVNPPKRIGFELSNEGEVVDRVLSVMEGSDSLMLVEVSSSDADRIRSFSKVANKLGRKLVMDERVAFMIEALLGAGIEGLPSPGDYLLWRRKRRGSEGKEVKFGRSERRVLREFITRFEDKLGEEGVIWGERRREVLRRPQELLVLTSNATRFLYEVPIDVEARIEFILSRSEPFSEESALSMERLMNWLTLHNVKRYYRIHVSGHMLPDHISEFVDSVNPNLIVPIHTEHPDLFDAFLPRRMRGRVILPRREEPIRVLG
ncbi:MAG: MBL fold metallo-hydrolase, partial [Candidatus Korarchaeum sp.]